MRFSRVFFLVALLIAVAGLAWWFTSHRASNDQVTIYYTKVDGASEIPWTISVRPQQSGETPAQRQQYLVLYAASQAVAGPPPSVSAALRFPPGTHVNTTSVDGTTATVDLSADVNGAHSDTTSEGGVFKALIWTLTSLPGIDSVQVTVAGKKVATLPGGSFELDEPLRRSDW